MDDLNDFLEDNPQILSTDWDEFNGSPFGIICMSLIGQYPCGKEINKDIPKHIRVDILEAFNCLTVNAPYASVMMSRRVIQQIAIEFGSKKDIFLGTALNELREKELINNDLHDALIEVKIWGDGGAHPGKIHHISLEEAEKVAELMFFLVRFIYPEKSDPKPMVEELKKIRQGKSQLK